MARKNSPEALNDLKNQVCESTTNQPSERRTQTEIDPNRLLSSGSTLLNLACSGRVEGAFEMGDIVTVPGSSSAGKTILLLGALAEAAHDAKFDEYELVFDDVENALRFDIPYLFGEKTAARIVPPSLFSDGSVRNSKTIEEAKGNILTRCGKKKPFIYVLDSLDALTCDAELERAFKQAIEMAKEDPDKRKELAGSYNTEKAKLIHEMFRLIKDEVAYNNSIVFVIQQLKQNFGAGAFAPKFRTSGGEGPFFYSSAQIWLNKTSTIKKNDRKIGTAVNADVRKNKLNGRLRSADFDIYYDYGIDDIGSMVDFMVKEGFWKKNGREVVATELDIRGTRPANKSEAGTLIDQIEEQGLVRRLRREVGKAWNQIEEDLKLNRKPKYA